MGTLGCVYRLLITRKVSRHCARVNVETPFLFLRNYWLDLAEILHMVLGMSVKFFFDIVGHPISVHMRTCTMLFAS